MSNRRDALRRMAWAALSMTPVAAGMAPRAFGADATPALLPGAPLGLALIDRLVSELDVDEERIYVTGQSMGGAGAWNLIAHRPDRIAAAAICCGSATPDDGSAGIEVPVWNFHGDADTTVPVS